VVADDEESLLSGASALLAARAQSLDDEDSVWLVKPSTCNQGIGIVVCRGAQLPAIARRLWRKGPAPASSHDAAPTPPRPSARPSPSPTLPPPPLSNADATPTEAPTPLGMLIDEGAAPPAQGTNSQKDPV
jgi:hypothetical protein